MRGATDDAVLERAASERRILLTHDVATLIGKAHERVREGRPMPGVIAVPQMLPASSRPCVPWVFTSVTVSTSMGTVGITETFTDETGCQYLIRGDLTRSDGG
jgi:hypothetical protein